jgi:diguanylate cyclase (GGDEF)-like protein
MATQRHFYIGLAAVLFAIAGYGALNILTQSRVLETEESLLAAKQHLERLIGFDALTGVANRYAFDETLEREIVAARRTRLPVSLLMIDVDHFKQINDFHGHQVGDDYLVRIAGALKTALPRATDVVARYGGEEFSAILPATDKAGAMNAAARIHQCIADLALVHPSTPSGNLTISIGFSVFDGSPHHPPAVLLRAADRALYLAKRHGRNCSEFLSIDEVTP